jgi:hypothetical protein
MSLGRTWGKEPFAEAKGPKGIPNGHDPIHGWSCPRDMIITGNVIIIGKPNGADKGTESYPKGRWKACRDLISAHIRHPDKGKREVPEG